MLKLIFGCASQVWRERARWLQAARDWWATRPCARLLLRVTYAWRLASRRAPVGGGWPGLLEAGCGEAAVGRQELREVSEELEALGEGV